MQNRIFLLPIGPNAICLSPIAGFSAKVNGRDSEAPARMHEGIYRHIIGPKFSACFRNLGLSQKTLRFGLTNLRWVARLGAFYFCDEVGTRDFRLNLSEQI